MTITLKNLDIRFDVPDEDLTDEEHQHAVQEVIDTINKTLQREPYGIGAHILYKEEHDIDIQKD